MNKKYSVFGPGYHISDPAPRPEPFVWVWST